ncbi:hypothetical protein Tco_1355759 [Tanacetum coccineum]
MDEYSQKWHNGTSWTRSTKTFDRLAAIQEQLNILEEKSRRLMKRQMSKVLHERGSGSLPSSTETNLRDHVNSISTTVEADTTLIRRIGSTRYAEMKDVFDSTENDLRATWKQNKLLNDQLLEAKLKHEIECCVLLSHECVNNNVHDEIDKIQTDSNEIQEGMQKRINILENDVQRRQKRQKQSLDFELQLQHEEERQKCEFSLKTVCETS